MKRRVGFVLSSLSLVLPAAAPKKPAELFDAGRVWNVHLTLTAAEWAAMEPKGGDRRPGGPGGMRPSPAALFVPIFMKADTDGNGRLSAAEFDALAASWFKAWSQEGVVGTEQLRQGLSAAFPAPAMGPGGPPPMAGANGRNGLSAAMGVEFPRVPATLEFEDAALVEVAARYKGNSTFMMARNSLKRSLKLDLDRFVPGRAFAGQKTLNLHNNVMDASWMNETLAYRLYRDAGVPAPRSTFARVWVTVPGQHARQYLGLYSIIEEVDQNFTKSRFGTKDGAILKPSTRDLFADLGADWAKYEPIYDPKTKLTAAQKGRVIDFARLVTSASDADFAAQLPAFLDVDEFARFMAVTVLLSNLDSLLAMGQNFYVHLHPETNRFQFLPWDLDHSFGQFPMAMSNPETLSIERPWQGRNRFLERVFGVPAFRTAYRAQLARIQEKYFQPERLAKQVDELAKVLRPAVAEESAEKLARFDKAVAGETVPGGPMGPPPMGGPRPGGFVMGMLPPGGPQGGPPMGSPRGMPGGGKPIKAFTGPRAKSVRDQLAGKPAPEPVPPGRGPGGPGGFNPAQMLERGWLAALDTDRDGRLTPAEFQQGFARWHQKWSGEDAAGLSADALRAGLERDLLPRLPGPPPGFGPRP